MNVTAVVLIYVWTQRQRATTTRRGLEIRFATTTHIEPLPIIRLTNVSPRSLCQISTCVKSEVEVESQRKLLIRFRTTTHFAPPPIFRSSDVSPRGRWQIPTRIMSNLEVEVLANLGNMYHNGLRFTYSHILSDSKFLSTVILIDLESLI